MQPIIGQTSGSKVAKDVSTATFMVDVIDASRQGPVIVDFWAPWCGPCKALGPALEKAVAETKGAVRMVKVNVDENQDLAAQMRIQSIPAVYAFLDGRPVDGFVGAVADSQIKTFVKRLAALVQDGGAPSPVEEALEQAKLAFAEGDAQTAATFYGAILQREPTNVAALAGLGRCFLMMGELENARQALERVPDDQAKHADVVALRVGLDLAEQAASGGAEARDLEARLQRSPDDHQARFDLSLALFAAGDRRGAVDHLLDIIKRDRSWNEDAARKQLLKLFEAFGLTDPLTVESRRRLSALLFS